MPLKLVDIGQLADANLSFGALTVLVDPQAAGKSIALQLLKLALDLDYIQDKMKRYGRDWDGDVGEFLDAYLGEGMRAVWREGKSRMIWKDQEMDLVKLVRPRKGPKNRTESVFFMPAQRVLTLRNGWPRPFSDYPPGDPFAVPEFSEKLAAVAEQEFGNGDSLFPQERRLKREFREMIEKNIFGDYRIQIDKVHSQKRLVLGSRRAPLPFMVWSAGQREFVPLLLGLYWLMPPAGTPRRGKLKWVVIEELEMGLHPRAINALMLMVFDLVARDYRVCLSTHSSQILEVVWALRHLKKNKVSPKALLSLFEAPSTPPMVKLAEKILRKTIKVHYFDPETGKTKNITHLDLDEEESGKSGWGGLSEFSSRANASVARAVANKK